MMLYLLVEPSSRAWRDPSLAARPLLIEDPHPSWDQRMAETWWVLKPSRKPTIKTAPGRAGTCLRDLLEPGRC